MAGIEQQTLLSAPNSSPEPGSCFPRRCVVLSEAPWALRVLLSPPTKVMDVDHPIQTCQCSQTQQMHLHRGHPHQEHRFIAQGRTGFRNVFFSSLEIICPYKSLVNGWVQPFSLAKGYNQAPALALLSASPGGDTLCYCDSGATVAAAMASAGTIPAALGYQRWLHGATGTAWEHGQPGEATGRACMDTWGELDLWCSCSHLPHCPCCWEAASCIGIFCT